MDLFKYIAVWLSLFSLNVVGFVLMGIDKSYAQRHHYRVSEKLLLSLAVLGGGIGIWIGMVYFKHKTRKTLFVLGVPLVLILEYSGLIFILTQ